ncbi:DUF3987 domain-containing protein [Shewanella sp. 125m-1]
MNKNISRETLNPPLLNVELKKDAADAGNAGTPPDSNDVLNFGVNWDTPMPIKANKLKPVMPLHSMMLPTAFRECVFQYAKSLNNTSPDFTAVSLVMAVAALAGGNVEIKPKQNDTWSVTPVMWGMLIGNASSMKTPSSQLALSNLQKIQDDVFKNNTERQLKQYAIQKRVFDKKHAAIETKIENAYENNNTIEAERLFTQLELLTEPEPPLARNIVINDSTMEALCLRLKSNPAGVLQFRDELSGWIASLNQLGREHERAFYLEAFNASKSTYTQERISRENIKLERVAVSIQGGIQPSLIAPLVKEKLTGSKDDGLLERLLQMSVYPDTKLSKITDIRVPQFLKDNVYQIFMVISQLDNYKTPLQFSFDKKAQVIWDKWSNETLKEQLEMPDELQSMWAKRPAHGAKLALVLHLIDEATKHQSSSKFEPNLRINQYSLYRAIFWMKYLKSHTLRIIDLGEKDDSTLSVESLIHNLPKLYPSFTKHTLSQKGWRGLKSSAERDTALRVLELFGHIRPSESGVKCYQVNPVYAPSL